MSTRGRLGHWRARWRSVDPLGPLFAVAALAVFSLYGFQGTLERDLGLYAYSALQMAEGVPPYVSVLNRVGPLAHFVPWLGVAPARLLGIEELTGMRVAVAVLSAGGVGALYLLGRDLLGSRLAGAVAASSLLTFLGVVSMSASGPRDKPIMLALLTMALLAMVRRSWVTAGVFTALTTLTWQPVFFAAAPVALVILATLRGRALVEALVRFTVGGAVPTALCVLGFWLADALKEFVYGTLVLSARYTGFAPFTRTTAKNSQELLAGFGPGVWVLVIGLVTTLVVAVLAVVTRLRHRESPPDPQWVDRLALGVGAVAGLALCLRTFNSWPDAFVLLPFATLGAATLVYAATRRLPPRAGRLVGVAVCAATLVLGGVNAWSHRDGRVGLERASVEAVLAPLPEDATVMSLEVPQALVFSGKTNPTRHQLFVFRLKQHIEDTYPGGLHGFVETTREQRPTVVVAADGRSFRWLDPFLESDYTEVGSGPAWRFYVNNSVGTTAIEAARESLHDVMRASGD